MSHKLPTPLSFNPAAVSWPRVSTAADSSDSSDADSDSEAEAEALAAFIASPGVPQQPAAAAAAAASAAKEEDESEDDESAYDPIPARFVTVGASSSAAAASAKAPAADIGSLAEAQRATFYITPMELRSEDSITTNLASGRRLIPVGTLLFRKVANVTVEYRVRGMDFEMENELSVDETKFRFVSPLSLKDAVEWSHAKGIRKEMVTVQRVQQSDSGRFMGEPLDPEFTETCVVARLHKKVYFVPIPNDKDVLKHLCGKSGSSGVDQYKLSDKENIKTVRKEKNRFVIPRAHPEEDEYTCYVPMSFFRLLLPFGSDPADHAVAPNSKKRKAPAAAAAAAASAPTGAAAAAVPAVPTGAAAAEPPVKKARGGQPGASASAKVPAMTLAEKTLFAVAKSKVERQMAVFRNPPTKDATPLDTIKLYRSRLLGFANTANQGELLQRIQAEIDKKVANSPGVSMASILLHLLGNTWLAVSPQGRAHLDSLERQFKEEAAAAVVEAAAAAAAASEVDDLGARPMEVDPPQ
jgi:hypothetical protein